MTSSREARVLACALGMGLVTTSEAVWAQDATGPSEERSATGGSRSESVRVDLGIALGGVGGLGGSSGAVGLVPLASAAFEAKLAGPAWLVVSGRGGHGRAEDAAGRSTTSSSVALRAGPRFEWPVVDRIDAGFHVFASGALSHAELDPGGEEVDTADVGGVAGASVHVRATRVFGVRVAIDVLRGGWARARLEGGTQTTGHVEMSPAPTAELTFTF